MTMIVRGSLKESASQSRLFSGYKFFTFNALIHFRSDKIAHVALAGTAVKTAAIFRENFPWAAGSSVYRLASASFVDVIADANDHENDLHDYANDCQAHDVAGGLRNVRCPCA